MFIKADLHIHSTVSPCADLEMSPRNIVKRAKEVGLDLIALTDHNSAMNCHTFEGICAKEGIDCLSGIEVNTREEFHVLCLFDNADKAMELSKYVYDNLPDVRNVNAIFGDQVYVNEKDEVMGFVDKFLGNATKLTTKDLRKFVSERGGLVIPSHVDRIMFSLMSQLGFIPDEEFSALEIYRSVTPRVDIGGKHAIISDSDAHCLRDIGRVYNLFEIESFSLHNVAEALQKRKNKIVVR